VGVCVFGGREKCCRLFKKERKKERKGKYVAEDLSKLNISSVHALELLAVCMHMQFKTALAFINQTVGCNLLLIMPTSSLIVY